MTKPNEARNAAPEPPRETNKKKWFVTHKCASHTNDHAHCPSPKACACSCHDAPAPTPEAGAPETPSAPQVCPICKELSVCDHQGWEYDPDKKLREIREAMKGETPSALSVEDWRGEDDDFRWRQFADLRSKLSTAERERLQEKRDFQAATKLHIETDELLLKRAQTAEAELARVRSTLRKAREWVTSPMPSAQDVRDEIGAALRTGGEAKK